MHILQPDSPLTEAAAKYEKSSGRKYRNGSNSARTFDKLMGKMQPAEITLEIVEKFAAKMKAKGYVKTSIDRTVGDVKLFVRFITGVSLTPPSPPVEAEEIHPETVSILRWAQEYCEVNNLARRTPIYTANRFVRMVGNLRVAAITTNDLCDFRKAQQAAGMSPATIESSIGDIQTMVKSATGVVLNPGKRLKRNRPQPRGVSLPHIEELAKLHGQRTVFRGTFQRYGIRPIVLPPVKTFCLTDIQNVEGIVLADHLWLTWRQRFSTLGDLQEGQVVEFVATVTEYEKRRYRGNRKQVTHSGNGGTDYRLSYPANVRVIQ